MKTTFFYILFLFFSIQGIGQGLKKYAIGKSACSIYAYCESKFKADYSADSSLVYSGECSQADVTYGVICVKLLNSIDNLLMAEDMVISYADFLKGNFNIVQSAGYGKGLFLNENKETRGVLDYWKDKEGNQWKIKAWTDGKYIGFVYSYSKKPLPEEKVNAFLNGFRLPGME